MIYRIDIQHFLTHMIDYFTLKEILSMKIAVISGAVKHNGDCPDIIKLIGLFPNDEIIFEYADNHNKDIMEKMYIDLLKPTKNEEGFNWASTDIYETFIRSLLNHRDVLIICDINENDYIDVFCKFLKKYHSIEVIDLNQLFKTGKVGPIYIDRDEIHDRAVPIARRIGMKSVKELESHEDGRRKLLSMMNKKEKILKLKKLGIKYSGESSKELDKILEDSWVVSD